MMQHSLQPITITIVLLGTSLAGCDWVDSTGKQGVERQSEPGVSVPVVDFEGSVRMLLDGERISLLEDTSNRSILEGPGSTEAGWEWTLEDQGKHDSCMSVGGYDERYAASLLTDACTDADSCGIDITEIQGSQPTEFVVKIPSLKAPVALQYRLSARAADGRELNRYQTICALAINEAPVANADSYKAIAGLPLVVSADDNNHLLFNDVDDVDTRNQALSVDTQAVIEPQYSDMFSLYADGGFIYRARAASPADHDGKRTDTFVYRISDGLHHVTATATIDIASGNSEPALSGPLPPVQFEAGAIASDSRFQLMVSEYVTDLDNDTLWYALDTGTLPEAFTLMIDNSGLLEIELDSSQLATRTGSWLVSILVSDGIATSSASLEIRLNATQAETNQAPTVTDIKNRNVRSTFAYDISVFFNDPDNDTLRFSSERLPPDLRLSPEGVLTGRSNKANKGVWFIVVKATDESGASVSDGFRLAIN